MGLGIGDLMKLKGAWETFQRNHPKFPAFLNAVKSKGIKEGSIIDIKITGPEGESLETNIKVTADDMNLMNLLR